MDQEQVEALAAELGTLGELLAVLVAHSLRAKVQPLLDRVVLQLLVDKELGLQEVVLRLVVDKAAEPPQETSNGPKSGSNIFPLNFAKKER